MAMSTEPKIPANGKHTDNGRPRGFSTLTPFLAVRDARAALSFYTEVFGARLVSSSELEGMIVHAELDFGCGRLQLGEGLEGYNLTPSDPDEETTQFSLGIYVPDVDRVIEAAIARGAFLREPIANFVSGDRFGSIRDPFGIRWSVMTRVEDLSDDESARRVAAWLAESSRS